MRDIPCQIRKNRRNITKLLTIVLKDVGNTRVMNQM